MTLMPEREGRRLGRHSRGRDDFARMVWLGCMARLPCRMGGTLGIYQVLNFLELDRHKFLPFWGTVTEVA